MEDKELIKAKIYEYLNKLLKFKKVNYSNHNFFK